MSFLLVIFLIVIGKIMIAVLSSYEYDKINISKYVSYVFISYITFLFLAAMACVAIGVFWLFKVGTWFTVSPQLFISWLDNSSAIKIALLADAPWPALQWINDWYLFHNIGWTCLLTVIVLIISLQFEIENNSNHGE